MLAAYRKAKFRGELFWVGCMTALRTHTICTWGRPTLTEWNDLITQKGVYLDPERSRRPHEVVIHLLHRQEYLDPEHHANMGDKGKGERVPERYLRR